MGRLSISQRLRKADTPDKMAEIAAQWATEWQAEYETHVRNFEKAIQTKDIDLLIRTTGWLKSDGKKRFEALQRVLAAVSKSREHND